MTVQEVPPTFTPPFKRLQYGSGHVYVDDLGRPVQSVTSILRDGMPKPALINWAGETTAAYAVDHWAELEQMGVATRYKTILNARWNTTRTASIRGTAIHQAAEAIGKGEPYAIPADSTAQVEAYRRFLDDWRVEPIAIERVVGHTTFGYAGTFDILALVNGEPYLLDIKTNASGVFPETALQLAAYLHADWSEHEDTLKRLGGARTGVVWLRPDGGYELLPVDAGEESFRAFLAAKDLASWSKANDGVIGSALALPTTVKVTA